MKRIWLFTFIFLCMFQSYPQHLDYNNLKNVNSKLMSYIDFTSYTASEGTNVKIGDYIEFGETYGDFYKYILTCVPLTYPQKIKAGFAGRKFEVVRITVNGKEPNKFVGVWVDADFMGAKYIIDYEPALRSGEVVGNGMTSDKALLELEKAKRKLDLQIITEEEYNKTKQELIKYIK